MPKPIIVLHGPNLNRLGLREPEIYGSETLEDINARIVARGREAGFAVQCHQSNHEGVLIDHLHAAADTAHGVIINPGGFTHTSVALRDAIAAIPIPVVEVHLSNIYAREEFRQKSLISGVCRAVVSGLGAQGYCAALDFLLDLSG
ncbi:MAG TPA: type II 3-dehydroquinate dehydratase [candidate division Zixibacteria bacterium]|nr:type II 3-dehydroquinate dehydratase [candidate division Zixibacteria bacterium]